MSEVSDAGSLIRNVSGCSLSLNASAKPRVKPQESTALQAQLEMKIITPGVFFAAMLLLTSRPLGAAATPQDGATGTNEASKYIQPVYVGGQVKLPQRIPYTNGMTLSTVIKIAKGVTDEASPTQVRLTREGKKPLMLDRQKIENGKGKDIKLQPGDMIFVPKKS